MARRKRFFPKNNKNKKGTTKKDMETKANKQLATTKTTVVNSKPTTKTTYTKYSKKSVDVNIPLGAKLRKEEGFKYNIVEKVKGVSFVIRHVKSEEDFSIEFLHKHEEREGAYQTDFYTLDANINSEGMALFGPFRKLAMSLGFSLVDFTVFVEYITYKNQRLEYLKEGESGRLIINDIYINGNWIRQKDLEAICQKVGLMTMPILYEGKYDEKVFETFANKTYSHFNVGTMKYGIFIKPVIEDENENKRMAIEILNEKYTSVPKEDYRSILPHEDILKELVEEFVDERLNEVRLKSVDKVLEIVFPGVFSGKEVDANKLLSKAVSTAKSYYLKDFDLLEIKDRQAQRKVEKSLNSAISSLFIKRYGLFNRRTNAN